MGLHQGKLAETLGLMEVAWLSGREEESTQQKRSLGIVEAVLATAC